MVSKGTLSSPPQDPGVVTGLLDPRAYPHPVTNLHLRQTYVSWLFFTGDFVYKVKKPVSFGYLNFETLAQRRHYCHREVKLNRRISPRVYLGVVSIIRDGTRFRIDGGGPAVEYAVRMHQLPEEKTLAALIASDGVKIEDVERTARRIAEFHRRALTGPEIVRLGNLRVVRFNVEENFEQTSDLAGELFDKDPFDDLAAYSRAFMDVEKSLFERRAREGRIRDGHGDLHCGNIFLVDDIEIIDCIEFNDRFRCLDVAADIAFLAMDLDHFGRSDLSRRFVAAYVAASGDQEVRQLMSFFKVYRAYVRAKVHGLSLRDPELRGEERRHARSDARSYFNLAHRYVSSVWDRPRLIVLSGLMGTGKTTVSRELARRWRIEHLSSDIIRKQLAGIPAAEHRYEEYGQGIYSSEFSRRAYRAMRQAAAGLLSSSQSVILDASFQKQAERTCVRRLATETGADLLWVECVAPGDVLRARLAERVSHPADTASDGRAALLDQQQASWDPICEKGVIRLDTGVALESSMEALIKGLFAAKLSRIRDDHLPVGPSAQPKPGYSPETP